MGLIKGLKFNNIVTVVTLVATIIGWGIAIGAKSEKVDAAVKRADDIEKRINGVEAKVDGQATDITATKTDVKWIRESLERIEKRIH